MSVKVKLSFVDEKRKKFKIDFPFDRAAVWKVKDIGATFVPQNKGGPYWTARADLDNARLLRKQFGTDLMVHNDVRDWARVAQQGHVRLGKLAVAEDADLVRVPKEAPDLSEFISGRPYQRADIKFMAEAAAPFNSNQPGLGKTVETIGAIIEADLDNGPNLVIAPKTSLEVVWETELLRFTEQPLITCLGSGYDRQYQIAEALELYEAGEPFWLIVNPAMVTYRRKDVRAPAEEDNLIAPYPALMEIEWNAVVLDEFHKMGLGNTSTLSYKAFNKLKRKKPIALSGTPIQGKPIKLFGVLHFLRPDEFTSKWRFANQWLIVTDATDQAGNTYGKQIHGIRPDREEEFYSMLSRYMVRRTKEEVLSQLPPKQYVHLWVEMEGEQLRQYEKFASAAEVKIDEENLSATSILAEYTRLRQFANAQCVVNRLVKKRDGEDVDVVQLIPTEISCKLPQVDRLLEERGITGDPDEDDGNEKVVIFSQFSQMVDMVNSYLKKRKINVEKLTGQTKDKDRSDLIRRFQNFDDPLRVLVMTTTAGGVSITLDAADTVIFLDETWTPDDQEQAEDRTHRGSRMHQVTVYFIRTKGTVEQYVWDTTQGKADTNFNILDARRKGFRAI